MKGDPPKGKCSKNMKNCRRWRRRPTNLTKEFKAKKGWLETHLWHAKRCKMIDYWGFKIAAHLNEKCLKSTFRSSTTGALLHDFSYWKPFRLESLNLLKFSENYGNSSILDFYIVSAGVQLCPIKLFMTTFEKPMMLLHPASIETGILDHPAFKSFIESYEITYSCCEESTCNFKLQGSKSESVLTQLFKLKNIENFPLRLLILDPRTASSDQDSVILSREDFDKMFHDPSNIPSDDEINKLKSELFIPSVSIPNSSHFPVSITKSCNSEYFLTCPRKWARVVWYSLNKIKPVKVAGIEQIDMISFENKVPVFPKDFVGSPAYEIWSESEKQRLETIYHKKPPAKRPAYSKLGIKSPFKPLFCNFASLRKVAIEIDGKGILTDFAEIYTPEKKLIGHVTSSAKSSLRKGKSTAIASVSSTESSSVLVRNYSSPEIFRTAKLVII